MKQLKKAYEELYETANISQGYSLNKRAVSFEELSHFVGMKGTKYDKQKKRLLIVGRAVNGWGNFKDTSCAKNFSIEAANRIENDNFSWVVYDKEKSTLRNDLLQNNNYYWLNYSPFWRTNKKVWMGLTQNIDFEDKENDRWVDYIAWTNLYKIAPKITGNPTTAMAKKQLSACKKVLKAEIELFNPTHILFVSGYKCWFEDFADIFDAKFENVKTNVYRGKNKNLSFAETNAITEDAINIVVSCRPEGRNEKLYIEDVIKAFS